MAILASKKKWRSEGLHDFLVNPSASIPSLRDPRKTLFSQNWLVKNQGVTKWIMLKNGFFEVPLRNVELEEGGTLAPYSAGTEGRMRTRSVLLCGSNDGASNAAPRRVFDDEHRQWRHKGLFSLGERRLAPIVATSIAKGR